ncbi:MAG TPA: dihydropteroate synthase [Kofleriaceae bacterium]|nr:dihydropteroate synthase [Kofleriaceae bacterium]
MPPPMGIRPRGNPCGVTVLDWAEPLIMGVVNVTPDSFSDGGRLASAEAAIAHGVALRAAGAHILDVGGEATNPRARPVPAEVELARVLPVLEGLAARTDALLSIDTTKAEVARAAIAAGADLVNDISGGAFDPAIVEVADQAGVGYVCGHLRGTSLAEVFAAEGHAAGGGPAAPIGWREVADELAARLASMPEALRGRTIVDPGLGFGKGGDPANLALCAHAGDLAAALGRPVLVGPSRKRFLARLLGAAASADADADAVRALLDAATVGACLAAVSAGAHIVRVHEVTRLRAALVAFRAVTAASPPAGPPG